MKMSLIVFGALAVSFLLRRRSAALRALGARGWSCVRGGHANALARCAAMAAAIRDADGLHVHIQDPLQGPVVSITIGSSRAAAWHRNWERPLQLLLGPLPAASTRDFKLVRRT